MKVYRIDITNDALSSQLITVTYQGILCLQNILETITDKSNITDVTARIGASWARITEVSK